jgi:mannonate dehydratase
VAAQYNSAFGSPSDVANLFMHPNRIHRRQLVSALAGAAVFTPARAQEVARRANGLPGLTIKDVKVITTSAGGRYRWVFLKIITSEPGLYGIGSANNKYQTAAVIAALETHLKTWLIGEDPDRIEDLWQAAQMRTYWRNGPVNNNVLAAMDMALWDIKGKRAGMPVYSLLGGKARDAVPVYDHQGGKTKEECLERLQKSLADGYRHVRIQYGEGYGGGASSRKRRETGLKMAIGDLPSTNNSISTPFRLSSNIFAPKPATLPSSFTMSIPTCQV